MQCEDDYDKPECLGTFIAAISPTLIHGGTLQAILTQCVRILHEHLHVAFARIWVLNHEERVLELQASAGMYTHLDGFYSRYRSANSKSVSLPKSGNLI
jgi:hypothetical protein